MGISYRDIVGQASKQPKLPSYSDLVTGGEEELSFADKTTNRLRNIWQLYKVTTGIAKPEEYSQVGRLMSQAEGNMPGAFSKLGKDIVNTLAYFGKKPLQPGEQPSPSLAAQVKQIFTPEGAQALAEGVPEMFSSLVTSPIEALYGLGLDKETLYALTPEQRAQAIKDTGANLAMFAAGGATGKTVAGLQIARGAKTIAAAEGVTGAIKAGREVVTGAVGRAMLRGTAEAAAGGAAYSAVSRMGEPDALNQILINGVLFAPVGAAFERIRMFGKSTDEVGKALAKQAGELAQTRQLQITTKDSYADILYKLDALESANTIAEAVVNGKIRATAGSPVVVPSVTGDVIPSVVSALAKGDTKVVPQFYKRPDGLYDMLVAADNKITSTQVRSFRETGLIPGQLVSVNGRDYRFRSLSRDGQNVRVVNTQTGKTTTKSRLDIRPRTDVEMHDVMPTNVTDAIWRDFRGFMIADAEGKPAPQATAPNAPVVMPERVQYLHAPSFLERVKSGIGRFIRGEQGALKLTDTDTELLYSRIGESIDKAPFQKGTGQQWKALLAKGSPQFERDWTGLDKWLDENKNTVLTQKQVFDKFDENQIGISEIIYGGERYTKANKAYQEANDKLSDFWNEMAAKYPDSYYGDTYSYSPEDKAKYYGLKEARDEAAYAKAQVKQPKFESYTEPGGENYRIIALTLDQKPKQFNPLEQVPFDQVNDQFVNPGHFEEPNILVWARVKDYKLPNGEKVLFVDELQSDWFQQMRKKGVRQPPDMVRINELKEQQEAKQIELDKLDATRRELENEIDNLYNERSGLPTEELDKFYEKTAEIYKKITELNNQMSVVRHDLLEIGDNIWEEQHKASQGVPDAPFKKTQEWQLLMMKRLIAEAAHNGYDRIALTNAELQFNRWGSERISWSRDADNNLRVEAIGQVSRGTQPAQPDYYGRRIDSPEELKRLLREQLFSPDEGLATKLWEQMQKEPKGEFMPRKAGMQSFYGQVLENTLKDYAKKLGVKIEFEDTNIPEISGAHFDEEAYQAELTDLFDQGHDLTQEQIRELRQAHTRIQGPSGIRSFKTPEELRKLVRERGQPLGRTNIAPISAIAAGGVAGLYGLTQGATPQERERNSLLFGAGAALLAGGAFSKAGRKFLKDTKGSLETPGWMKEEPIPGNLGEPPIATGAPDPAISNIEPRSSFQDMLDRFGNDRGFSKNERAVLERELVERLFKEAYKNLDPKERAVVESLNHEIENTILHPGGSRLEQAQIAAKIASEDVIRKARSNGMYVDEEAAGNLILRDAASDRVVGRFKNTADAIEFIDKSGQAIGEHLDGGGMLPPIGSGLMPIDDGPPPAGDTPYAVRPNGRFGAVTDLVNTVFDWATPNRNIITSLDSKFGTRFFAEVYDKLQVARTKANAAIRPWYEKLKVLDKLAVHMSKAEREQVSHFLETMSPEEVKARGGTGGRALNPDEIRLGEYFASKNIDLSRVQKFNREMNRLADELEAGKISQDTHDALAQAAKDGFAMDDNHLEAARVVQGIKANKNAFMGAVTRYANSIMNKDVTRAEFAAANKMSGSQLRLAYGLEDLYGELARAFNIPEEYRLQNFMTHARLYTEGNVSGALRDFDMPAAVKDFYSALARTGEISSYEKDPVRATQRYIKAGFDSRLMAPALEQARQAVPKELLKLPDEVRGKTERVVKRYMYDVQGIPAEAPKFTQAAVDDFLPKLGLDVPVKVREDIVNLILATGEAAMQGFRVIAGLRDFTQGVGWYYARFGLKRTLRLLEYGTKGLDGVTKADLQAGGLIPELNVLYFATPTEFTGTTLGRASNVIGRNLRNVSQIGLKLSGQKDVYAMLHAGSYLDTWKLAGEQLQKLTRGEISKRAAYDKLQLQTYEPAAITEFDSLVNANRIDDAARLLARETGREQVGVFGSGNNPGGWNRNIGRIAGQYGSWSMWYRAQLMRMASRGTVGQRSAAVLRLAATQAALAGTSVALGVSLKNWYAPAGALFTGGPLVDAAQTVADAIQGTGYTQEAALNRLKRYLPYDPWSDEFNVGQIYIPGSYFVNDLVQAYQMSQQNDPMALPRAIGVKPAQ